MNTQNLFHRYTSALLDLPTDFEQHEPLPATLHMAGDGRHEVYYAPFDHVNSAAKVVLVGITPGRVQAIEAISTARQFLKVGMDESIACAKAKNAASFAGPMRRNLVSLLDHVGLADRLGVSSTSELWASRNDLVHFTSALRYPVFENGKNFSGSGLTRSKLLLEQLDSYFGSECESLSTAMFVPLGTTAQAACERMVAHGRLQASRVLTGLPHPSGANAERIAYFLGRKTKDLLSSKTNPASLDAGRYKACDIVAAWSA